MGGTADQGGRESIKAALFDLDGTLHDRSATLRRWLGEHTAHFGLPEGYAPRFLELDDFGYRSKSSVMPQLVEEFSLKHDPQVLLADFSDRAFVMPQAMPYAPAVLRELRGRGVKTGIVTNGWVELQTLVLQSLNLFELVDDVVISKAVGLSKPDPRIYELALQRLGVQSLYALRPIPEHGGKAPPSSSISRSASFLPLTLFGKYRQKTSDISAVGIRSVVRGRLATKRRVGAAAGGVKNRLSPDRSRPQGRAPRSHPG